MAINIGENENGQVTYDNQPDIDRTLFKNLKDSVTIDDIEEAVNQWMDDNIDADTIADAVNDWLDEHPEATTTIEDGSILPVKLNTSNSPSDGYVLSYNATASKFEWVDIDSELDDINEEISDLKQDLTVNDKCIDSQLNRIGQINADSKVVVDGWESETEHGYGVITSEFIPTTAIDHALLYNTDAYRGYINYYDVAKTKITTVYVGNDLQYSINKSYPYFKFWFYKRDQSTITSNDLEYLRFEKICRATGVISNVDNDISNLINNNGVWNNALDYVIGGYRFSNALLNQKLQANASLARIRNVVPIRINHNNAIIKGAFDMTYQMYYGKVDEENNLLSIGDSYVRTVILPNGLYYLMFKKADGSSVSDADVTAIANAFSHYSCYDDNADHIDYSELFCLNWYTVSNGKVSLGDSTWTNFTANHTTVVIPEFYTDHDIYIRNSNLAYKWIDIVSDADGNVIKSTDYITTESLVRASAGYHHIMVARNTATTADFDAMSKSLSIYATRQEINTLYTSLSVINRNIDMQNVLYALRKSDRYGNDLSRTVFIAHATDSHGDVPRWKNFLDSVNYYLPELVVHTGDIVNYTMLSDTTYFLNDLPDMPVLLAIGNHETGVQHDIGEGGATNQTLFEDLIEPLNNKYDLGATKTYYSYDVHGIRFIVVNVYDYDANDGTSFVDRSHIYYSQAQINWINDKLQDACANNIPVVMCAHECDAYLEPSDGGAIPFNQTYQVEEFYSKTWEGNPICDLIEAFIDGTSINQTYTETGSGITLSVNTSFAQHTNKGHFVCWLVGHRHADYMGFLPDYSQLVISPCATACSIDTPNSTGGYSDLPRREGERCEDAFNFYMINPTDKTIGIVRFGSNVNFDLRERNYYKTSYVKSV